MRAELTDKQRRVLAAIRRLAARGEPAALVRIAREAKVTNMAVPPLIHTLEQRGLVTVERIGIQQRYRVGEDATAWLEVRSGGWKQRRAPREKKRKQRRACMCCGKSFLSEGPHNRLCGPCRQKGDDGSPYSVVGIEPWV